MGILMFSRFSGIPMIVLDYTLSSSGPNDSPVLYSSGQSPSAQLTVHFVLCYFRTLSTSLGSMMCTQQTKEAETQLRRCHQ